MSAVVVFLIYRGNDGVSVVVSARLSIRREKGQTLSHASASRGPEAGFTSEGKEPSPMGLVGGAGTGKQRV